MNDNQIQYGSCVSTTLPFDRAVLRVRELLKDEGFGVLTEIDVAKILKEKRGIDFQQYIILGACNPDFAYEALLEEEQLGLLLPCNVVVTEHAGTTLVSAVDAAAMLGIVGKASLLKIAEDVDLRLHRVLSTLAAES